MKCQTHNQDVCISTGIHDGLTFGHGELCEHGFWDTTCWEGEALYRRKEVEELEVKAKDLRAQHDRVTQERDENEGTKQVAMKLARGYRKERDTLQKCIKEGHEYLEEPTCTRCGHYGPESSEHQLRIERDALKERAEVLQSRLEEERSEYLKAIRKRDTASKAHNEVCRDLTLERDELTHQALSRKDAVLCVEGLMMFEDHRAKGLTLVDVVELRLRLADRFKLTNDDL